MIPMPQVDSERRPNTTTILPLETYDLVIVSFSGGKDSIALVLDMIERGVPKDKIQLWHQSVDGRPVFMGGEGDPDRLRMDWPVTEAYCQAFAKHMGLRLLWQWKNGGFHREMMRKDSLTAPNTFELQDGTFVTKGGTRGKLATRGLFPQVSADLSVRYCSPYLKIDVSAMAVAGDPALKGKKILYLSGERRQESTARSKYAEMEAHRTSSQVRRVDHWRSVIDWSEVQVWDIMRRHGIVSHPGYRLGYSRLSCQHCIFEDANQAATNRAIDPRGHAVVAGYEQRSGKTIKRGVSLDQLADKGTPYSQAQDAALVALAMGHEYPVDQIVVQDGQEWILPAGAFGHCGGPS